MVINFSTLDITGGRLKIFSDLSTMHYCNFYHSRQCTAFLFDVRHTFRYVQLSPQADIAVVEEIVDIEMGPYFPHYAWLLCSNRQTAARIARIRGVVWVGPRPFSHKLAPALDVVMQVAATPARKPNIA